MNDPLIARFADACGATSPLHLRVELVGGGVLAEGTVHQPFTLVGRDDACDVTLTDPEVNLRHAWVQVVGGRAFAVDLGTRTGLVWPSGPRACGRLAVGEPVRVGPFAVSLRHPPSPAPAALPDDFALLHPSPLAAHGRPAVALEFRNGRRARDRWPVNRLVTLVGRAPECKIHLNADDIASYHCGLVLTPDGLWVVDLSGRGVVVNGERMRVAPLPPGAELWVGRFLIACEYTAQPAATAAGPTTPTRSGLRAPPARPAAAPAAPSATDLRSTPPPRTAPRDTPRTLSAKKAQAPPEDEVPLGVQPAGDSFAGLPSSHIMADAFLFPPPKGGSGPGTSGPPSLPISVSEVGPPTAAAPPPAARPTPVAAPPPRGPAAGATSGILLTAADVPSVPTAPTTPGLPPAADQGAPPGTARPPARPTPPAAHPTPPGADPDVARFLKQLGEVHAQMFEQFQQSMLMMVQMFGQMHRDQVAAMQTELVKIQELNAELARLQTEVARQGLACALGRPAGPPSGALGRTPPPAGDTVPDYEVLPQALPLPKSTQADIQHWVFERITALQRERQTRWQKLVGYFGGKPEG